MRRFKVKMGRMASEPGLLVRVVDTKRNRGADYMLGADYMTAFGLEPLIEALEVCLHELLETE